MGSWREIAQYAMDVFNWLTIFYFFAGNGIYTILMAVALGSALTYDRRLDYEGLLAIRDSDATPPVTVIIPAFNEGNSILETVRSALREDYPGLSVLVVDDGSTDDTVARLIQEFGLSPVDLITRSPIPASKVYGHLSNPALQGLVVLCKEHGGKADALNVGVNFCRTPYFCTLDADCIVEPNALLRLMRPILRSSEEILVSGGTIRVRNGCEVECGQIRRIGLPRTWIERLQVVEYLRGFLSGRAGWDLIGGTLIVSGALAVFQRQAVLDAGGFNVRAVSEDMELIVRLHRRAKKKRAKTSFILGTVCWTECPSSLTMLARQRRRWQLGLCQALASHSELNFNPRAGVVGLLSFPFHLLVEGIGPAVEFIGYIVVPLAFALHLALLSFYIPLVILSLIYASFLSLGGVLLEEIAAKAYPERRDLYTLLGWCLFENFGFRQLILYFRFQGILQFLAGFRRWEKVTHAAESPASMT